MKTYKERTNTILEKVSIKKKQRTRRITVSAGLLACVIAVGCYLFNPFDNTPPNVDKYQANEYYDVIAKLNEITYVKPGYGNNWGEIEDSVPEDIFGTLDGSLGGVDREDMAEGDVVLDYESMNGTGAIPENSVPNESGSSQSKPEDENYQETTDNQVAGVIEGDRIKRSSKYIYYMNGTNLHIYTIAGENSAKAGSFVVEDKDGYKLSAYKDEWEMFLSKDCSTITILSTCYNHNTNIAFVCLINLDVTDPANVQETGRTYLSGKYLSARLVDEEILLISRYNLRNDIDFDDPSTFVPQYGTSEEKECVPGDKIVAPEKLDSTRYTVICKLDQKTLASKATGAFLSYADDVYVSSNKIYATRPYYSEDKLPNFDKYASSEIFDNYRFQSVWTEISAMDYSGDTLKYAGSVTVEGTINNQYNLDEYEGVLRVVTTTNAFALGYINTPTGTDDSIAYGESIVNELTGSNASLYCIDLSTWKVIASVERFAPHGESVQSVRFDKDKAYVCTAIVLTDPVFVFDLSDLNNITYKDTGTITGYSSSLINFGEDYLLGIGYGASFDTMKLEIYTENATGVESVCSYEVPNCYFATEYKSYYIHREKHLIGIGYDSYNKIDENDFVSHYTLFLFDGYDFVEVIDAEITGSNNYKRAVLIDGYFYMFGENFAVQAL